jgi:acyl-CoA thioesterase FadM
MSVPLTLARTLIGAAPAAPTGDLLATLQQPLRAWPWLCDSLRHINNARYLDLLGYGRLYWLLTHGLFRAVLKQRMSFMVAGVGGIYRRQIPRMAEFVLNTRVAAYDERWLYFEQVFVLGARGEGPIAARFLARGQLHMRRKALAPRAAIELCGGALPEAPPEAPPDLGAWCAAQDACLEQMR